MRVGAASSADIRTVQHSINERVRAAYHVHLSSSLHKPNWSYICLQGLSFSRNSCSRRWGSGGKRSVGMPVVSNCTGQRRRWCLLQLATPRHARGEWNQPGAGQVRKPQLRQSSRGERAIHRMTQKPRACGPRSRNC